MSRIEIPIIAKKRTIGYIHASGRNRPEPTPLIQECRMTGSIDSRSERYLRFSHRSMVAVLVLMVMIGTVALVVALRPDGVISQWLPRVSVLVPVAIVLIAGALRATLGGDRWTPDAPEARAILQDEWRRMNMARASRAAFVVVLAAQVPLGLWLGMLPSPRGVMAMAVTTMTFGLAAFIALFLYFERSAHDGG
ncbi:MAG TPA: hypothetical protein VHQ45_06930 [Gemmatimonadaceae bacterium]|nr:hypothetical protein [Gemmatimonadaceae bacterium]